MRARWIVVALALSLLAPPTVRADGESGSPGGTEGPNWDMDAPLPAGIPDSQEHECECGVCVHPMRKLYSKRTFWVTTEHWWLFIGTYHETLHYSSPVAFGRAIGEDVVDFGGSWLFGVHYDSPDHPEPVLHECGKTLVNIHGELERDSDTSAREVTRSEGSEVSIGAKVSGGSKTGKESGSSRSGEVSGGVSWSDETSIRVVQGVAWRTKHMKRRYATCECGTPRPPGPATTTPSPNHSGGGPTAPTQPSAPGTAPTQAGRAGKGRDGGDGDAPAGPKAPTPPPQSQGSSDAADPVDPNAPAPPTAPEPGDTATTGQGAGAALLNVLINQGTIGAGDTFSTAITVKDAETADAIRSGIESGEYVVTQNGVPVDAKVTPTPQHVTAFNQDPATTVYVTSTVMPARKREMEMNLERRTPSGSTEVVGTTTVLTQSKVAIFENQGTGQVEVVVTGTETPWGDADPKFELRPNSEPQNVGTPNDVANQQGEGSTIWTVLKGAGFTLAMAAGGVVVAELLEGGGEPGSGRGGPVPNGPAAAPVTPTGGPAPNGFADDLNRAYTPTGHNSVPTGWTPTQGVPVITEVSGASGVVANPNSDLSPASGAAAYVPAVKDDDWVTIKIEDLNPWADTPPAEEVEVTVYDGGAPVASPPVGSVTEVDGALLVTVLFQSFNYTDSSSLSMAATVSGRRTPPIPFTTILTATPLTASASTLSGGIVNIDVRVEGCGQAEQWVMTWNIDAPNVYPLQEPVFGEGSGVFTFGFKGDGAGVANLRPNIRRVEE